MAIEGISRIDAAGSQAGMGTRTSVVASRVFSGREPARLLEARSALPTEKATQVTRETSGVELASAPREVPGADDTYVRIRYDKGSHTYIIQVLDSTSDEVVREIPPDAWSRINGTIPLPKGMIVERAR